MRNEKEIHWQQGVFIDSPRYARMGSSWRAQQIHTEKCLVRPSPKGNAVCRANHPDDALWIATRLNLVDEQQAELAAKDKQIKELGGALSMALDACYELDSHGAISENANYVRALELLKGGDL